MKRFFLIIISLFSNPVSANWFTHLVDLAKTSNMIQHDILNSDRDIESLMRQLNSHTTGSSGWGNYQFHDYQSYGMSASHWNLVLQMTESGGGSGALGQTLSNLSRQFPIDRTSFNRGVNDPMSREYYALKSRTTFATRAASQLDYDTIQAQINYQHVLQQQIERTRDIKSAMDLSNRIQVEGNLINLEMLRQIALTNQQQAVNDQGSVNSALANARFLTKD